MLFRFHFRFPEIDVTNIRILKMKRKKQIKCVNNLKQVFNFHFSLRFQSFYCNLLILGGLSFLNYTWLLRFDIKANNDRLSHWEFIYVLLQFF